MFDYQSFMLALGVSGVCLVVTLFGTWFSRRTDGFILTLVMGLCLIVTGIFSHIAYNAAPGRLLGCLVNMLLMTGFAAIYAASVQFRLGTNPRRLILHISAASAATGLPPILAGFDGVGYIVLNIGAFVLLMGTARQYWLARAEAPGPLSGMAFLYAACGVSFILCAGVLVANRQWIIGSVPDNWAEHLNIGVCIAVMTGNGALSLALHQWRMAAHHRREAMTDALTGLLNRRALFEKYGHRAIGPSTAVVLFDLDRFKAVNDEFGHSTGDLVLKIFAEHLADDTPPQAAAGRIGGEEFALIVENTTRTIAQEIANSICRRFAASAVSANDRLLKNTVSAGVAFGSANAKSFEAVIRLADEALYEAKRAGRNRVVMAPYLAAANPLQTISRA